MLHDASYAANAANASHACCIISEPYGWIEDKWNEEKKPKNGEDRQSSEEKAVKISFLINIF